MLLQDVQPLKLLEWGHYILLIASGPVPMLLDALQFQFMLGLPLTNVHNLWSVLEQPLFCMMILGILLWVNRRLQNLWQTDLQLDASKVQRGNVRRGSNVQRAPLLEMVEVAGIVIDFR